MAEVEVEHHRQVVCVIVDGTGDGLALSPTELLAFLPLAARRLGLADEQGREVVENSPFAERDEEPLDLARSGRLTRGLDRQRAALERVRVEVPRSGEQVRAEHRQAAADHRRAHPFVGAVPLPAVGREPGPGLAVVEVVVLVAPLGRRADPTERRFAERPFDVRACVGVDGGVGRQVREQLAAVEGDEAGAVQEQVEVGVVAGAEEAKEKDYPLFYDLVEGLTISSGTPMPELYIQDKEEINAFATGRKPEDGKICVTRGALENLDKDELEGVLAHELAHIKNHDILFMTVAVALIGVVSILSEILLHSFFWGGNDDAPPWAIAAGIILAVLAPISARMVQLAMSRKREYLADASGAKITRYPEGLASALEKISEQDKKMEVNKAVSHLYFSNPFSSKKSFFSTHPPIEKRIERLRNM